MPHEAPVRPPAFTSAGESAGRSLPDSSHVWLRGLDRADDRDIWEFALQNGFTLVTKDKDFGDLSPLRGFPPKVLWLRIGNCTTSQVEELMRRHQEAIEQFERNPLAGVLELT